MTKRAKLILALATAGVALAGLAGQASAQAYFGYGQMTPMQLYAYQLMLQNMQPMQGYGMQGYAAPMPQQGNSMQGNNPYVQQQQQLQQLQQWEIQQLNHSGEQMMQQSLQNSQQFDQDMFGN